MWSCSLCICWSYADKYYYFIITPLKRTGATIFQTWFLNQGIRFFVIQDHIIMFLLLFNWPPFRELCPNNEVTKSQTGTSLILGSFAYCYAAIMYAPPLILSFTAQCLPDWANHSCPFSHTISGRPSCPFTVSPSNLGISCIRPIMPKSPRLPLRSLHGVLCSPGRRPSPSFFSVPL